MGKRSFHGAGGSSPQFPSLPDALWQHYGRVQWVGWLPGVEIVERCRTKASCRNVQDIIHWGVDVACVRATTPHRGTVFTGRVNQGSCCCAQRAYSSTPV